MLNLLLSPAIAVSQLLSFRRKFLLIFLAALLPGLWLLAQLVVSENQAVDRDRRELAGVAYQVHFPALQTALGRHRSLSTQWTPNDKSAEADLLAQEHKVDDGINTLKTALDDPEALPQLQAIEHDWQALKSNWRKLSLDEGMRRHSALIAAVNAFSHQQAGDSGLLLDPDASSYYLVVTAVDQIPLLRENISQLRTQVGLLSKGGNADVRLGYIDSLLNSAIPASMQRIDNDIRLMEANRSGMEGFKQFSSEWMKTAEEINGMRKALSGLVTGNADAQAVASAFKQIPKVADEMDRAKLAMLNGLANQVIKPRLHEEIRNRNLQVGAGLAIFLLVAYLIGGFARDISQRAESLETSMHRVAEGDLTTLIASSGRDELGRVITSAHRLAERLRDTMTEIRHGADELKRASDTIAALGTQVVAATAEQSDAASQMAAAVEELTVSIGVVANDAGSAHQISDESGRSSVAGAAVVQETVDGIEGIALRVRETSKTVSALGDVAGEIASIVDVIKDIADMTNLLALNAAIEAARAGESGAGFAVVADAVRKLAERTATSTQDVSVMVDRIRHGAESAVREMHRSVEQVEIGVTMANQAGAAIGTIREGSARVVGVVCAISDTLREQAHVAEELARNVESIAQMSEDNRRAAESSAATAQALRTLAGQLEVKIGRFKLAG
ncbi:methyl-accepting chemotaxis protein [Chitinimonas sp.]|uniref:methyl-accepting chemotaxis protein n=1 Tax=Chitinimonas sp. TaxID=1934313 RepID=UPI0035AE60B9